MPKSFKELKIGIFASLNKNKWQLYWGDMFERFLIAQRKLKDYNET